MKLNITIVASIIGCIVGVFIGIAVYSTFFCVDTNQAIVEQLKKDNKALTEIKKEVEIKYVYRDKIKTVIKNTPADECLDRPVPDSIADGVRDAFQYP